MGDVAIDRAIQATSAPRLAAQADAQRLADKRISALDRAERREWAHKKYAVGGESRWQETVSAPRPHGRRRFVYDPKADQVVEIN